MPHKNFNSFACSALSAVRDFGNSRRDLNFVFEIPVVLTVQGLLATIDINAFKNIYPVVQYHRLLRPIAPGSLPGISSGPEGVSAEPPTTCCASVEKPQFELDHCQTGVSCGLAAAHSRCQHSGGARRNGRHRVSQTAGTRLGAPNFAALAERINSFPPGIQPDCISAEKRSGPAGNLLPLISLRALT